MELFNLVSENEKRAMKQYICDYVSHTRGSGSMASLDYLYRYWDEAKSEYLYKMLGNQFIYKQKIELDKPISIIQSEVEDKMYEFGPMRTFKNNMEQFFSNYCENNRNLEYKYYDMIQLLNSRFLATNDYQGTPFSIITPDDHKITVLKGCRTVKMLGKIANAFDVAGFEEFRLAQSLITNQRKIKGVLNISIHPLDYMTMSDNESGWSSCMSWKEGGCYCRGTVEMMNSKCVVVAYLDAENPMSLYMGNYESLKWSNKKWRQLFIVSKDILMGIKAYPYKNMELSEKVIDILKDLCKQNLGWEFTNHMTVEHSNSFDYNEDSFRLHMETYTMYNDCGTVKHVIALGKDLTDKHITSAYSCYNNSRNCYDIRINYSGKEICMWCGNSDESFDGEGTLSCDYCADFRNCDCCEERYSYDELRELDGNYYCENCYEDRAKFDVITGEDHLDDNFKSLYIVPDGFKKYLESGSNIDLRVLRFNSGSVYRDNLMYPNDSVSEYFDFSETNGTCPNTVGQWGSRIYYIEKRFIKDNALDEIFYQTRESVDNYLIKHYGTTAYEDYLD